MPLARSAGKAVFVDVLGGILNAPVFWYGRGLVDAAKYCGRLIVRRWKSLGLGVWIVNIFVPMYGQRDIAGTLISIGMRIVQIIFRGAVMILWTLLVIALFLAYLVVPIFIFIELLRQIVGAFGT
jgi:hypothetical protein